MRVNLYNQSCDSKQRSNESAQFTLKAVEAPWAYHSYSHLYLFGLLSQWWPVSNNWWNFLLTRLKLKFFFFFQLVLLFYIAKIKYSIYQQLKRKETAVWIHTKHSHLHYTYTHCRWTDIHLSAKYTYEWITITNFSNCFSKKNTRRLRCNFSFRMTTNRYFSNSQHRMCRSHSIENESDIFNKKKIKHCWSSRRLRVSSQNQWKKKKKNDGLTQESHFFEDDTSDSD